MADKYLVPCDCGNRVAANVNQAGSQIACTCGKLVDVPPLRKLRQLPLSEDQPRSVESNWSPRHAATVGGLAIAAALLLWGGYLWVTEPTIPTFDEGNYGQNVEGLLKNGTPLQFWQHWRAIDQSLSESGFEEFTSPQLEAIKAYVAQRQLYRNVVLGVALLAAVMAVVAWFCWPKPRRTS